MVKSKVKQTLLVVIKSECYYILEHPSFNTSMHSMQHLFLFVCVCVCVLIVTNLLILSNTGRDQTRNDHCLYLEEITKDMYTCQKPSWKWLKNMRGSPRAIPDLYCQGQTLSSLTQKVATLTFPVCLHQRGSWEPGAVT